MRPLTEEETKTFFAKLAEYIGRHIKQLLVRKDDDWLFRYHRERVYYISARVLKDAASIPRKQLLSAGTCFGHFSKTGKFRLQITALKYLAQFARFKVWVKPKAEMSFLYGNHVLKSHMGRITENTPQYQNRIFTDLQKISFGTVLKKLVIEPFCVVDSQGVVVYNMADLPLGFGRTAKSTLECRNLGAMDICVFHQADVGEFLRGDIEAHG